MKGVTVFTTVTRGMNLARGTVRRDFDAETRSRGVNASRGRRATPKLGVANLNVVSQGLRPQVRVHHKHHKHPRLSQYGQGIY